MCLWFCQGLHDYILRSYTRYQTSEACCHDSMCLWLRKGHHKLHSQVIVFRHYSPVVKLADELGGHYYIPHLLQFTLAVHHIACG